MIIRIITRRRREVFRYPFHNNLRNELFPFLRLQEPEVIRIVVEKVLDEYCRAGKQVLIMHKQGMSNRDIASEIGINKCTVNEYMRKVRLDPMTIDELIALDDPVLEGRLFAGSPAVLFPQSNKRLK